MSLPTRYSSQAFTEWLERYYTGVLQVVFSSESAVFAPEAEPFAPKFFDRFEKEKKKTVAKMYQYYNNLFIQQHLERVNDLCKTKLNESNLIHDFDELAPVLPLASAPDYNLLLKRCASDDDAAKVLGLNRHTNGRSHIEKHPEISIRYSNSELLAIYKKLGRFEHPLGCLESFHIDQKNAHILKELTKAKPNVVIDLLKDEVLES